MADLPENYHIVTVVQCGEPRFSGRV